MKKICLWSCPRNISTALMYSFRSRPDSIVFDEPLYAHYLNVSNVNHPGKEEVLESQEVNGNKVIKDVILKEYTNHSFFKLMTQIYSNSCSHAMTYENKIFFSMFIN